MLDQEIAQLYAQLSSGVGLGPLRERIETLSTLHSQYPPLVVLEAQLAFLERDIETSLDSLGPLIERLPQYTAAALLMGHIAESLGQTELAWRAFRGIMDTEPVALHRVHQLQKQVLDLWIAALDQNIATGRLEESALLAEQIFEIGSEDPPALLALARLAGATGDLEAELDTRRLLATRVSDSQNLRRIAEIEIEIGDIRSGLEHLEALNAADPSDIEILEQLELAKFLWRLRLLPPEIQRLRTEPELDRAQFAVLLYWLVPDVRFARISDPPIANDILDHQWRDELLQVLSLRLIEVDQTLHRFFPSDAITREDALSAWLELLRRSERALSCFGSGTPVSRRITATESICRRSAQCGLISTAEDCLPGMSLSGSETLQLFKRGLDLLAE